MFKQLINLFLSEYMAAYRENYSANHVLIRLIENWKKGLDQKFLVGTVLMDLSKAFDCVRHDLLIAKLYIYGVSQKAITFIYLYLKRRKQKVSKSQKTFKWFSYIAIRGTTRVYIMSYIVQYIS